MGDSASAPESISRSAAGRYELRGEIARGGMGVVFLAYDRLARREVAYKRLQVAAEGTRARFGPLFEREYAALAQLSHPNIVQVYEYGFEDGTAFYTMELLAGRSLRELVPMPLREACALLRDVASALGLVHARRLVHRDVSPSNVRLSPDGRGKLIDFGALTSFGMANDVVGTPSFIAPECLTRTELDARTDLFSLGAVAYWLLTGRSALSAGTLEARLRNPEPQIDPPSIHVPGLPVELDELVLSMLRGDPRARPENAAEVMERLTAIAELPPEPNEQRVAFSYLTHPPLVGRSGQRELIRALLQEAAEQHTRVASIEAPPGLGRTALLDQIAIDAQLAGCTVLRAQGGAHARPFGLAQRLVRAGLTTHPQVESPSPSVLPLLVEANAGPAASPVDAVQRHGRAVAALQATLVELGRQAPIAILVDDAHRADVESLAVLALVAYAAASSSSIAIVLSVVQGAGQETNAALTRLMRDARHIPLEPLSAQHILDLVVSVFGPAPNARRLARWLFEKSQGRPSSCIDRLRVLLLRGLVHYATGTFSLPHDLDDDVASAAEAQLQLARLHNLSDSARSVAELLSLQDVSMTPELISAALDLDSRDVVLALEELRGSGVVRFAEHSVTIASDSMRSAIAGTLDDVARRALHLRVARALAARGSDAPDVMMLIGANLMRGGDEASGVELLTRALRRRWYDPDRDATPVALLEAVLEAMRKQGRSDEQCVAILVPLVRAGFSADYLVQLRHLDRTLAALCRLCGVTQARELRPVLGKRPSLFLAVGAAAGRFQFIPRTRRLASFREAMIALFTIATAGAAAAVSAFDAAKAREIVDKLEPLEAFPEGTAAHVSYQFVLAAFEIGSGDPAPGAARYAKLLARLERGPVPDLDDEAHAIFRLGCLYGLAQAELAKGSPRALAYADQLSGGHPFYEPHAEATRMAHYALRGEQERADVYRERAEMAALRGGMSWSSVTVVTVRCLYAYVWWRNPMGVVQLIPELGRLAKIAPNLILYCDLARAYLEVMRGQALPALALFEQVLRDPRFPALPTTFLDRTGYAQALCAAGRFERAIEVCADVWAHNNAFREDAARHVPLQQMALAEAALGRIAQAAARVEACLRELRGVDHPLIVGSLHRDRARIALLARDDVTFRDHLRRMSECFRPTNNPWLIRQCDQLAAQAQQATRGDTGALGVAGDSEALTQEVTFATRVIGGAN